MDTGHTVDTPPGSDPATASSQRQCYCSEEICQQPPALASPRQPGHTGQFLLGLYVATGLGTAAAAVCVTWISATATSPPLQHNTDHYTADIYLTTLTITLNTHSSVSTVSTHGSTNDNHCT